MMTVLPDKHYSGHGRATETEDDQRTREQRSGERNVDREVTGRAGVRWRWQHKTELDGDK